MPDFLQPGSDGALDLDVTQWRKGLVYTANHEIPAVLQAGREYRVTFAFKRKAPTLGAGAGYGELYRRVCAIVGARTFHFTCPVTEPPEKMLMCQGWRHLGETDIAAAFVTVGLLCPEPGGGSATRGAEAPTMEELLSPGGATLDELTRFAPQRVDEIFNEFDFSDPLSQRADPVIVSYGEAVPLREVVDFAPFVERAERLAGFYHGLLQTFREATTNRLEVIRREWYRVTNENLVVVHLWLRQ